jgi:uncharacterized membrane protein YoaK (UPF0700 family)
MVSLSALESYAEILVQWASYRFVIVSEGVGRRGSMSVTYHVERDQGIGDTIVQLFRTRASALIASVMATRDQFGLEQLPQQAFDGLFAAVLSITAGAVDVIGFLALGGLFTAHITGNIVILVTHYTTGGFSRIGPMVAVPVFIVALAGVVWVFKDRPKQRALRALLILQAALLAGFLALSVALGPFSNPGSVVAASVGMLGVVAMATQNALVKLDLPGFPTTAVLTTDTVLLAIDLVTLACGNVSREETAQARRRIRMTIPAIAGFVAGCAVGGLLEVHLRLWALVFPVVMSVIAVPLSGGISQSIPVTKTRFPRAKQERRNSITVP